MGILYKLNIAPTKYKPLNKNQSFANIRLSTLLMTDKTENTRKTGNDCLRLSLARIILADKSVIAEVSPPVYVQFINGTLCKEKLITKKRCKI